MSENKEIAHRPEGSQAIAETHPLGNIGALLDSMMSLAKDPSVDAAKFETIARVVRDTREDAKKEQFYQDKAAAMLDMPVIDKRGKIVIEKGNQTRVQGTYAIWSDLQRAIAPVLARYNLAITHDIGHENAVCLVTPVLQHRNGYVEKGEQMALPLDTSGGKNNTQGAGSAASYGKRHTTIAMLGIRLEDTDDDGWLTATPDEPLNDQQARRVSEAEARWAEGPEIYEQWFHKLEPKDRAWLVQTGRHGAITGKAALPSAESASASDGPQSAPRQGNGDQSRKAPSMTAEQWVEKYEADCAAAVDLDALALLQDGARKALDRLKGENKGLHDRAVKAGSDAYSRLSGASGGDDFGGEGD